MKFIIDEPHSNIDFSINYLERIKLTGSFERFEGTIESPDENFFSGSVFIKIDASSIRTNNSLRDETLKSNQFFDTNIHPNITFRSHAWNKINDTTIMVKGDLTMKGISKPLTAEVAYLGKSIDMQNVPDYFFSLQSTIDRTLFDMPPAPFNNMGIPLLSNHVEVLAAFSFKKYE